MKKTRLLFLLSLFLTSIPLLAQTEEDAKAAAMKFLQQKKGNVSLHLTSIKMIDGQAVAARSKSKSANVQDKMGDVYAFNADGGGFAVVCTGNGNTAVAGYSDKGKVDVENMPDAMKELLTTYAAAMASTKEEKTDAKERLTQDPTWIGPSVTPVAPLLKTQWGQGAPFNGKCPSNGKQTTLAGCVPVALAQVINFYRSDHKGTGQLYYAHQEAEMEYDIDYANVSYDWGNMLNTYEEGKYTQAQADAVGKLMVECGVASKASYGYDETSASIPFVALNKYYGFDCIYLKRDFKVSGSSMVWGSDQYFYQPTAKWMTVIQDELTAGRPIIYSATNRKGSGGIYEFPAMAHCFVIDGIDADNYVHCNWGWGGLDDGYFDVALLRPADMEFLHDEQGFKCHHEMIVGIQPSTSPYEERLYVAAPPFGDYNFVVSNSYDSGKKMFSVFLMKEGQIAKYVRTYSANVSGWPYLNKFNLSNSLDFNTQDLEDGTYELRLASVNAAGNGYNVCPLPKSLIPKVTIANQGKDVTYHGLGDFDFVDGLTIENISPASDIYAGTTFYLAIKGHGFKGKSSLVFRNVDTGTVYNNDNNGQTSFSFEHIYDDYTSTQVVRCIPKNAKNGFSMPAGRYKIELPEGEENVKMNGEYYIDVKERPAYPVMDGSDWGTPNFDMSSWGDNRYSTERGYAIVGLNGDYRINSVTPSYIYANKVEEPVTVKVYMVNIDTGEEMVVGVDKEWIPEKSIPLNFYTYPFNGNFRFRCQYETADGNRGGLVQYRSADQYKYYMIPYDVYEHKVYQLVSANTQEANGQKTVDLTLKNISGKYLNGTQLKAIFYDKENDEVSVKTLSYDEVSKLEPDGSCHLNMAADLKDQTEYQVWLLASELEQQSLCYVLDENHKIASFVISKDGSTGISSASLGADIFKDGEKVKVYDMKGILIKTMTATSSLWTDLQSQLPEGNYILKSSCKSIKFRN